jgi:hypothetical protein
MPRLHVVGGTGSQISVGGAWSHRVVGGVGYGVASALQVRPGPRVGSRPGAGSAPHALTAGARWRGSLLGLGTAACWSVSPLLIRVGLDRLPNPILGVTTSMIGATIPQGIVVAIRARRGLSTPVAWDAIWLKLAAGVLVGASTWTRWEALALTPVAVVLAALVALGPHRDPARPAARGTPRGTGHPADRPRRRPGRGRFVGPGDPAVNPTERLSAAPVLAGPRAGPSGHERGPERPA